MNLSLGKSLLCTSSRRRRAWALAFAALALAVSPATAAPEEELDALFRRLVEEQDIPGLAAVLVQRDRVLLSSGYGYANLSTRQPVDPARTLFPLGSVSKLFTSIAVLQLVEQGTIGLDDDINRHLAPVRIDSRFPEPIRIRHLLTHTDGLDVRWLVGGAARVPEKVLPLQRLVSALPPRVTPPGEIYLYSDVGMTVAGYIVERVSREPFADYMARHVFAPLGMNRTTFRITRDFDVRHRATGYDYDRTGTLRAAPIIHPHAAPASGAIGPVADLAPLMMALLRADHAAPDTTASPQVLGGSSVRELWRRQFSHHPEIPGTGYGLYEFVHQGRRALVHGGLLPGFTTVVVLLPDADVGLCVAANRFALIDSLENELLREVLNRFAPPAAPTSLAVADGTNSPTIPPAERRLAGTYRCDQYSRFSVDKLFVLAGLATDLRVEELPGGGLRLEPDGTEWREIAPLLFENPANGDRITFQVDDEGRGTRLLGSAQRMSYHRVGSADDVVLNVTAIVLLGLVSCLGGFYAPRLLRARSGRGVRALRLTASALAMGWIAFFLGAAFVARGLDFLTTAYGEPTSLALLRLLPVGCAVAGIVLLALALRAARTHTVSRSEACVHAVAALAALLLIPLLAHWQLVPLPAPELFIL